MGSLIIPWTSERINMRSMRPYSRLHRSHTLSFSSIFLRSVPKPYWHWDVINVEINRACLLALSELKGRNSRSSSWRMAANEEKWQRQITTKHGAVQLNWLVFQPVRMGIVVFFCRWDVDGQHQIYFNQLFSLCMNALISLPHFVLFKGRYFLFVNQLINYF